MNRILAIIAGCAAMLLAGCVVEDGSTVNNGYNPRPPVTPTYRPTVNPGPWGWVGRRAEGFFINNGAPARSVPLGGGRFNYVWEGGVRSKTIPARYAPVNRPAPQVNNRANNNRVVRSDQARPAGAARYEGPRTPDPRRQPNRRVVEPARTIQLRCEVNIVTNSNGVIERFNVTRDTEGMNGPSRCREVIRPG